MALEVILHQKKAATTTLPLLTLYVNNGMFEFQHVKQTSLQQAGEKFKRINPT